MADEFDDHTGAQVPGDHVHAGTRKGLWTTFFWRFRASAGSGSRGVRAKKGRPAHGGSSNKRFARGCSLASKTVGTYSAQLVEVPGEGDEEVHVLEASDDEMEAEYQEAVSVMTVARQRRAEVNRARQFFRESQSFEGRKAQLDKLKQTLPRARCGQLGHRKDDNDCPAKVKAVD